MLLPVKLAPRNFLARRIDRPSAQHRLRNRRWVSLRRVVAALLPCERGTVDTYVNILSKQNFPSFATKLTAPINPLP